MRELRCLAMPQSFQNISMKCEVGYPYPRLLRTSLPCAWHMTTSVVTICISSGKPLFWAKVMEKISQFIVRDQKQKTNLTHWNLDPMKLPNQDVILDRLEKASPRWIWCSFLNFNEPNMEGENETSLKVCSVFFHTYKLRTRPDSSKSRIFDMSQRSSVLKLQNQLKWKPQLRVCVPGSINSLYWR